MQSRYTFLLTHHSIRPLYDVPSYNHERSQIKRIIDTADASPPGPAIGALTSENRDVWADARQALLRASPSSTGTNANEESLRKIESAVIVIALDDSKPITRDQVSWNVWSGNAKNRWYDKHQIVVFDNGRSGFLGTFSFTFFCSFWVSNLGWVFVVLLPGAKAPCLIPPFLSHR